ncbi:activator of middle period transcription [Serratia phage PS2]|uniref:Activator of middle period transcription n=1 Tax=Serratia phage PS2 TaxID=1481112 RepID=A0A023W6X3_9CAUD|nr:MotA-like activator of middle period transcription [Serratia phage PS2]AHY25502.1 activator of middle period transcription [Serratia phage PS2]WDS61796.1 activator of middle period transcription [Cronobacter phage vB_Cdu_VP8]
MKLNYIISASADTLNEKTAAILIEVAKKNFITSAEIRETLTELNASSVNSNIGVLIKKNLIEKSGDGLIITEHGDEIVIKAAELHAADNKPELLKDRKTRTARAVTADMKATAESIKKRVEELDVETKDIETYRSNLWVTLTKRAKSGVRKFEVLNKGMFRIFGYKVRTELLDILKAECEATVKEATSGNCYIDMPLTEDVINFVLNIDKEILLG